MATTVTSAFATFKSRLEVTPLQAQTLSERHQRVRKYVGEAFRLNEDFLIGSYVRDTACRPVKDVDIMVVLHWGEYGEYYKNDRGPYALLSDVKKVLVDAYPTTTIRVDGQAVSLKFTDFTVDVVPAFGIQAGGWWIPDSPGDSWIRTNPKKHGEIMTEANKRCDGMFKPLVKMMKAWNRNNEGLLKGFLIEAMANSIYTTAPATYATGMMKFFDQAYTLLGTGVYDPANGGDRVDANLTASQRTAAKSKLFESERRARQALDDDQKGYSYDAVTKWREIIGDPFPVWG